MIARLSFAIAAALACGLFNFAQARDYTRENLRAADRGATMKSAARSG